MNAHACEWSCNAFYELKDGRCVMETCVHTSSNMPCEFNAGSGCVFSKDKDRNGRLQRAGADECATQTGTLWLYNKGIEGAIPRNVFESMGHTQRLMMHMNKIQGIHSATLSHTHTRARAHTHTRHTRAHTDAAHE